MAVKKRNKVTKPLSEQAQDDLIRLEKELGINTPKAALVWAKKNRTSALARYLDLNDKDKAADAQWVSMIYHLYNTIEYRIVRLDTKPEELAERVMYAPRKVIEVTTESLTATVEWTVSNIRGRLESLVEILEEAERVEVSYAKKALANVQKLQEAVEKEKVKVG